MGYFANASRTVVFRASRDTLGLVVVAATMTFALAYAVHSRHDPQAPASTLPAQAQLPTPSAQAQQPWAGHLAEVVPSAAIIPSEPMTSASLVVPKSQLALPAAPAKLKPRGCAEPPCQAKAPLPPTRQQQTADAGKIEPAREPKKTLLGTLNPLNHLPEMSAVGRPFAYAGNAVSSWIKRF